ncbi:GNAT family N-acetyltransferase [Pseudoalteromonas umbrosa]|uniref:GNAT family N-acetyltransferase n=1 Tax=Pseudoalteromonas umbrosa TaxID=3048489 RepID=UPI0024C2D488|nr:GNAT family N-acetyltransferase [Pseudoalteromonas sp. B95]MDK1286828.1 GNAT family N-acetyltransferase [Pseudoalteromonas sp. B95]
MYYTLRKANVDDLDFLMNLRRITMDNYLLNDGVDISDSEHLFRIKHNFEDAQVIEINNTSVGLFKASFIPEKSQWYIFQIQILPLYQGLGIGREIITSLCEKANKEKLSVGLSVLKSNPAKSLYDSLGFRVIESNSSEYEMVYDIS